MNTINVIINKIERAGELDFGQVFNESIDLFKKSWLQGLLLQIFTIAVMLPIIVMFYIPFITAVIAEQEAGYGNTDAMENFMSGLSILFVVFIALAGLFLGTLTSALYAAYFRILKKIDYNENFEISDFFYFIKGKYLGKIFILTLIAIFIMVTAALLCFIPLLYFIVPLAYLAPIFAFNEDLNVSDIYRASFKLGTKKWLITLGLLVVIYLCVLALSLLTCGLGSIFLKSIIYNPVYVIYKKVIGFSENTVINETGTEAV